MTNRDDFTEKTKEFMAKKVGFLCSKPDCRKPTIGSKADGSAVLLVGTAAHITAASKGGPRYNPALTSEQRKHESNGIWLCPGCGRLVDADAPHFTVEILHEWKLGAEKRAFESLAYALPGDSSTPSISTIIDSSFAKRLGLPEADDIESCTTNLISAANNDLSAFKRSISWPKYPVLLSLKLVDGRETKSFSAENLAAVNNNFHEIAIIAHPGTGKTTTLIQIAENIQKRNDNVAIYIPLREWAIQTESFLRSISQRSAFVGFKHEHFMLMAHHGRLTLFLDGWNELNGNAKQRVSFEIKALRRDYPDIRMILSTRYKELDIPLTGPVVKIDALSEEQQKEIALSLRGDDGVRLLEHAWRTPGIRDLISVPLYLTALLSQTAGATLPTTKEEVLRMFVENHENNSEKASELRRKLFGVHRKLLCALATEATYEVTTALSESEARNITKKSIENLIEQGQLALPIEPVEALNAFVDLHTLIRSEEDGTFSFQHQQFQEWYASFYVETLALSALAGDVEDLKVLRENVIDERIWEEPILFACERLSRAGEVGIDAVSFVIMETLGIDPLLSAEIIYRSSNEVWKKIKLDIIEFSNRWHIPHQVDRAVSFMINTGRSEFLNLLWPLISNLNDQVNLKTLRSGKRFRVSILGDDIQEKISELSEKLRVQIISGIAHYGDMLGMELAARLAIDDPSSKVKYETISALLFRRAERNAIEILKVSPGEVWADLAKGGYADEISEPEYQNLLRKEAKKYIEEERNPLRRINALISIPEQSKEIAREIEELLVNVSFPSSNDRYCNWTVENEFKKYPDAVINALIKRLESNKEMPINAEDYLRSSDIIIDEGSIVDKFFSQDRAKQASNQIRISLAVAGPYTVGKLIEKIIKISKENYEQGRRWPKNMLDEYSELMRWISQTNDKAFVQALLNRPESGDANEISLLAELMARHGGANEREKFKISDYLMAKLVALAEKWSNTILKHKEVQRYQLSEVARAIGRIASGQLTPALKQLLDADLVMRQKQEKECLEALENGRRIDNGAHTFFYRSYTEAFAAIGDEAAIELLKSYLPNHDCGCDAAIALKAIWKKRQSPLPGDSRLIIYPDFTEVKDRRAQRSVGNGKLLSDRFAEDILSVVINIISSEPSKKERQHALDLAEIAFTMPYGKKVELINALFQLQGPASEKIGILTALVTSGEEISGELILEGINDIFYAAEDKKNQWMLNDQNGYRIRRWMVLLPFSDQPEAIIEVFKKYREKCPHVCNPRNLTEISSALGNSPHHEAVNILKRLAEIEPGFIKEHEWIRALIRQRSLPAAITFFELTQTQEFSKNASQMNVVDFGRDLAYLISNFPTLRKEIYQRYKGANPTPSKSVIETAIAEVPDIDGIFILIRECASEGRKLPNTSLYTAIRNLIVGERESRHSVGWSELYSVPAQDLRKGIFEILTNGNKNEVFLAKECLIVFDEIRDDYGIAESERRHPNISTGKPWPLLT